MAGQFAYTVTERLAVLSVSGRFTKELRRVAFGDNPPRLDVRKWQTTEDGERMGKGVTLTDEEAAILRDTLNGLDL